MLLIKKVNASAQHCFFGQFCGQELSVQIRITRPRFAAQKNSVFSKGQQIENWAKRSGKQASPLEQ